MADRLPLAPGHKMVTIRTSNPIEWDEHGKGPIMIMPGDSVTMSIALHDPDTGEDLGEHTILTIMVLNSRYSSGSPGPGTE